MCRDRSTAVPLRLNAHPERRRVAHHLLSRARRTKASLSSSIIVGKRARALHTFCPNRDRGLNSPIALNAHPQRRRFAHHLLSGRARLQGFGTIPGPFTHPSPSLAESLKQSPWSPNSTRNSQPGFAASSTVRARKATRTRYDQFEPSLDASSLRSQS
jgi:hypothetical protein